MFGKIPLGRLSARVRIAINAPPRARIIGSNVLALHTSAQFSLALVLWKGEFEPEEGVYFFIIDTLPMMNPQIFKMEWFGARGDFKTVLLAYPRHETGNVPNL